jgi:hypothetical protein
MGRKGLASALVMCFGLGLCWGGIFQTGHLREASTHHFQVMRRGIPDQDHSVEFRREKVHPAVDPH